MSEKNTGTAPVGGFQGDPAEAFHPAAGSGCCGSPAANTGATESGNATVSAAAPVASAASAVSVASAPSAASTAGPCCGTASEAKTEGACCGTAAKAEAVAAGQGCCG